jgi:hypothetical protein
VVPAGRSSTTSDPPFQRLGYSVDLCELNGRASRGRNEFWNQVSMTRVIATIGGLMIAAAAFYFLATGGPDSNVVITPNHDSIDDDSRKKLEGILRDADG